ncbi:MAG: MFS transporter [Phycisphaerae bacterium]|nr:MFS transporter [Phycisphaerae bacterium]
MSSTDSTGVTNTGRGAIGVRLSVMMFFQLFVWGAWYVTVSNYMTKIGLADSIGHAYTVGPIAAIISPFFLGMIADRFFSTERVLGVMHLIGGAALLAAPAVADSCVKAGSAPMGESAPFINPAHVPFLAVLLLHMLCYMPTLGLTNTISFHNMSEPAKQFPLVRVFGTIGWIAPGLIFGFLAKRWVPAGTDMGDKAAVNAAIAGLPHFFYLAGGAGVMLGLYSFSLPHTPPPAAGRKATIRDVLGLDALALMKEPSFLIFILSSFLICVPLAAYYSFAPVFAGAMGISPDNVPIRMSYGQVSEVLFMVVMPFFFARLGVKWMLAVAMLAWAVRYGLFAAAPGAPTETAVALVVAGIILHGICYDFFFVTGFIYVDRKAPKEIRGQAQGLLVLVTQGLGLGVGAQIISRLVAHHTATDSAGAVVRNWPQIWLIPCIAAGVILVLFLALFRESAARGGSDAP